MDKQRNEIEQMAKSIPDTVSLGCTEYDLTFNWDVSSALRKKKAIAKVLIDAGYGDVKQAQKEILEQLVIKLSERFNELNKQEQLYVEIDDIETAVRFNVALREVNRLLDDINKLLEEVSRK